MGSRCGTWRHRSNDGACSMRRDEFNTDTRTVTTYDESGAVVSTRPYTADENATVAVDAPVRGARDRRPGARTKRVACLEAVGQPDRQPLRPRCKGFA